MPRKKRNKRSKCAALFCCTVNTADSDDDGQCKPTSPTHEVTPEEQPERTVASITKDIMERNKHLFEYPNQYQREKRATSPKQRRAESKGSAERERPPRRKKTNALSKTKISVEDSKMTINKDLEHRPEASRKKRVDHSKKYNVLEDVVAADKPTRDHRINLNGKNVKDKAADDIHQAGSLAKEVHKMREDFSSSTTDENSRTPTTDKASGSIDHNKLVFQPDNKSDKSAREESKLSLKVSGDLNQKETSFQPTEGLNVDANYEAGNTKDKTIMSDKEKEHDVNERKIIKDIFISSTKDECTEQADESAKPHESESSPKSSVEGTERASSPAPECEVLPDHSPSDSSTEDCSKANKILKAYTQSCTMPKDNPSVPIVPVPPKQAPTYERRTFRRASKPRVRTQDKTESEVATSPKDTARSSSPPVVKCSDMREELILSPDVESYERSHSESSDSSLHHNRASKSDGSNTENRRSPPDLRPSDLREEMTISPGLRLTYESSSCDSANQEELPILPETSTKTKTPEERFSSLPNPFGKNPVLETKLPNRLGSSSLVLGAIGSQNTPEKVPTPSQNRPAARRLDFSKHLMFSTDKKTAVESSSEESLQDKGLDDLLKPESKENLINKKFSRLSQSAFPTSPSIRTVETKPAWSFYDKDFTSKPSITSGFRKEVRAEPAAAAAPKTRDLPPPQPRDDLLAPSLFGRRPGKDLPPVMGKVPSPRQPQQLSPGKMLSNIPTSYTTSPTFNQPFPSNQMQDPYIHDDYNPCAERVPRHSPQQMRSSLPFHSNSPDFHQSAQPFPRHQMQGAAGYPSTLIPAGSSFMHRSPQLFSPGYERLPPSHQGLHLSDSSGFVMGYEDDLPPRHCFQNPNTIPFSSSPKGLLKREKTKRYD